MNSKKSMYFLISILFLLASVVFAGTGFAGEYTSLKGLNEIKAVFDVRGKNIKALALQLDLVHKTFHDASIRSVSKKPEMSVVFGGGAVKLISSDREEFNDEEKMLLGLIENKLMEMSRDGIRLEVCLFALDVHDVEPDTIPEHIYRVDNGWISLIGYQQHGYSLVAIF